MVIDLKRGTHLLLYMGRNKRAGINPSRCYPRRVHLVSLSRANLANLGLVDLICAALHR